MLSVPAIAILNASAALAGEVIRPDLGNTFAPDADTVARFTARLNEHLPAIWNGAAWPDLAEYQRRRRVSTAVEYEVGAYPQFTEVWNADTNRVYRAMVPLAAANATGDPGQWALLRDHYPASRYVPGKTYSPGDVIFQSTPDELWYQAQGGQFVVLTPYDPAFPYACDWHEPDMGDLLGVSQFDPRSYEDPCSLPYELREDAVRVGGDPGSAWFYFRRRCPLIVGPAFDSAVIYQEGDQVFWAQGAQGDYYDVLAETLPGETPASQPFKFAAIRLPARFAQWLSAILGADWLRWDRQQEKAADREVAAQHEWDRLMVNLSQDQRQSRQLAVRTGC
jgi:hypothetical protein